jgi:hypothetical protein
MLAGGAHDRQGLFLVLVGGAGLTLDELALGVYLDDVYWAEEAERAAR